MLCFFTTHCSLRLIVRSESDIPTFATRRLYACHHARAPGGKRLEMWARNFREFCLNAEFHVTFMDLLHVVKLRHGTDGFTSPSPPEKGVLRNFFALKTDGFRPGANPRTWVPKASTLTLDHRSRYVQGNNTVRSRDVNTSSAIPTA